MVWLWCDPLVAYQRNSQKNPRVLRENFMKLWRAFEPPRDALLIDSRGTSPEVAAGRYSPRQARKRRHSFVAFRAPAGAE